MPEHDQGETITSAVEEETTGVEESGRGDMAEDEQPQTDAAVTQEDIVAEEEGDGEPSHAQILRGLAKEFRETQASIQEEQAAVDSLKKEAGALQADIKELEKSSQEIAKIVTDYGKALPDFEDRAGDLREYAGKKRSMIEANNVLPKEIRDKIEERVDKVDKKIGELEEQVDTLGHEYKVQVKDESEEPSKPVPVHYAEIEQKNALVDLAEVQEKYEELKESKATIEEGIKGAEERRKRIEASEDEDKYKLMHYHLLELEKLLDKIELKDKATFSDELDEAWKRWVSAKAEMRSADDALNRSKAALDTSKANLENAKKDRDSDIVAEINLVEEE